MAGSPRLGDTPFNGGAGNWLMSDDGDATVPADLPASVFDLRDRAYRARRHAAAIFPDEAACKLLAFAEELEAKADALEHALPNGGAGGASSTVIDTTG